LSLLCDHGLEVCQAHARRCAKVTGLPSFIEHVGWALIRPVSTVTFMLGN